MIDRFYKKKDTYKYKGWMNSDYFLKRALGVVGHYVVGALVIYLIILALVLVFVLVFGLVGLILSF